ncbi:cytochrome c-type biogenesis protein [Viridibacterium curvum]|uniref:Cytochrome c-type biogenesis protein n=1 Tax=Viridibacterium curvum TaxID=1101404 RepID=A0ABP9R477_9RHOO
MVDHSRGDTQYAPCPQWNLGSALRTITIAAALPFLSTQPLAATDPVVEARVMKLAETLRCLVCQNQSIAESNADLANDLKRQVREMIAAGKSDDEIRDYMVERYGDFVLYDPPVKTSTLLLWGGPATLLLLALGGFALTVRARRNQQTTTSLSDADKARARALLDSPDA